MTNDDTCNATKNNGDPCTYTAKYPDGKCGIHTDESETQGPGRPSKLTIDPEIQDAVTTALSNGATRKEAAEAGGITYRTLVNWEQKGEEFADDPERQDNDYVHFFQACADARVEDKQWLRERMRANGEDDWRQQAWELERKYPGEYKERSEQELEHTGDGLDFSVSEEQREQLEERFGDS